MLAAALITFVGTASMTAAEHAETAALTQLVPAEVRSWKPKRADGVYTAKNLFDYIDGGAEVYLSFNIQQMLARRYAKPDAADLIADVFDMGSSKDAFGAYHHDMREGSPAGIGQESEYQEGSLAFWKDRYFVSVLAMEETDDSKQAVLELGKAIARAIPREGPPPDLLDPLPQSGLMPKQIHYFHNHFCLNAHYFLADENLLDLGPDTEGFVAHYAPDGIVLVLVRYPSEERATRALATFAKRYLPDAGPEGTAKTENGKWAGVRRIKNLIVGVFDAPEKDRILSMFDKVKSTDVKATRTEGSKHE